MALAEGGPTGRRRARGIALVLGLLALTTGAVETGGERGGRERSPVAALEALPCPAEPSYFRTELGYDERTLTEAFGGSFVVYKDLGPDRLEVPIDWRADPYGDQDWRSSLHSLEWIDQLLAIHRGKSATITGESDRRRALITARRIVVDWVRENPLRGRRVDKRAWVNKVAGERAGYIAYVLRESSCEGLISDRHVRLLTDSLGVHARFLDRDRTANNHGLFAAYGLALIGRELPFVEELDRLADKAVARFRRVLDDRIESREGIWLEHSSTYQLLVLEVVRRMARLTGRSALERLTDRMERAAAWFVTPAGSLVQFGDTYRSIPPPRIRDDAAAQNGLRAFSDSGYAFAKDRATRGYLGVTATHFSRTHKHADDLSFDLFDDGRRIVSDSGRFSKTGFQSFARSAQAHSTLTVDGVDFGSLEREPYGSGILASGVGEGWFAIRARNPGVLGQGVDHERLFLYRPLDALIVLDSLDADQEHRYERRIQLEPGIDAEPIEGALRLTAPGFAGTLSEASSSGPADVAIRSGEESPTEGFLFPEFRQRVERSTVTFGSNAADAVLVMTIDLGGAAQTARPVDGRNDAVLLEATDGAEQLLSASGRGGSLEVDVSD